MISMDKRKNNEKKIKEMSKPILEDICDIS